MKTFRSVLREWWNAVRPASRKTFDEQTLELVAMREKLVAAEAAVRAAREESRLAMEAWRREIFAELNARPARVPEELSEEEMRMAFAVTREETWFVAVRQVIRQHFADNVQIVSDPALVNSPGGLAGAGQSIGTLRTLLEDLERRRRAASEIDGDEDEDEE